MLNLLIRGVAHVMSWLFIIGIVGCLAVIPVTAYQLFSVLFEKDAPDEVNPRRSPVI
jgi:hypothetical protein